MNPITRRRWARIEAVLDRAFDLEGDDLPRLLDSACASDAQLRADVGVLLAADRAAIGFLETPATLSHARQPVDPSDADETRDAETDERIGPYRVLREIGRGGMGAIYLGVRCDGHFRQRVALKLIRHGLDSKEIVGRFLRERQILATLQHPCIARLLDGGVTAGSQPFFAMEYVDGVPITRYAEDRQLSVEQRVRLYLNVCDAVGHAHRNGVVHRDIKPSNILVTADGAVKLLDFGIAKLLDEQIIEEPGTALTREGLWMMTPEYAAPEQVRKGPITPATDVYALGAVLYELLAGTRLHRFEDASALQIERIICERTPIPPSAVIAAAACTTDRGAVANAPARRRGARPGGVRRRLSRDLDSIVLKALDKEPARRYTSAERLADDLRRHLSGQPVRARPARGLLLRKGKLVRAQRVRGSLVTSLLAAGFTGAALVAALTGYSRRNAVAVSGAITPELAAASQSSERVSVSATRGAGHLTTSASPSRPADAQDRSPTAQRFYEEGLRAQVQGDTRSARRLFWMALGEDSMFAFAAFRAIGADFELGLPSDGALESRVLRLAAYLPERERLMTRMFVARSTADPSVIALADTVVIRYPNELDGRLVLGASLLLNWRVLEAVPILQRVVAMDSLGFRGALPHCRGCEAMDRLISAYGSLDSLDAAERVARQWIRLQPASGRAWDALASVLDMRNAPREAMAAREQAARYRPLGPYDPIYPALLAIRAGQFEPADRLLRDQMRAGSTDVQFEALWFLAISLRYQGRFREALDIARQMRLLRPDRLEPVIAEAQILLESGRPSRAAVLFDSVAARPRPAGFARTHSALAAWRTFRLMHVGMARAGGRDTLQLAAFADTVQRLGAQSLGGRERTAHHHVRGLLHVARGDLDEAARSFYRATMWPAVLSSPFTRTNLELARNLLALGRPNEAVRTLRPAFHGLEASSLYVTHTDLHETLARAWDAIGQHDSAAVHYRWALGAWKAADPVLQARRELVQRRLEAIERLLPREP